MKRPDVTDEEAEALAAAAIAVFERHVGLVVELREYEDCGYAITLAMPLRCTILPRADQDDDLLTRDAKDNVQGDVIDPYWAVRPEPGHPEIAPDDYPYEIEGVSVYLDGRLERPFAWERLPEPAQWAGVRLGYY